MIWAILPAISFGVAYFIHVILGIPCQYQVELALLGVWTLASIGSIVAGDTVLLVADGANAGLCAYLAWRDRPRKQRRPSKVAGLVRDLGHRLTVEPQPQAVTR